MNYFKLDLKNKKQLLKHKNLFDGNLIFGAKKFHKETNRTGKGPSSGKILPELKKVVSTKDDTKILKKYWEVVKKCPICKSTKTKLFIKRFCLQVYKCENCTVGYLSPRIKYNKAIELYSNEKSNVPIYSSKLNIRMDNIKFKYGLSLVNALGSEKKRCLDLGTGRGVFLNVAKELGWQECYGVDANKNWSKIFTEKKGITLIDSTWESLNKTKFKKPFELISMWDALEHTYDLDYLMNFVSKNLKKNGYFMVFIPNFDSLATKLMRNLSPTFNWKHTLHFNEESLKIMSKKYNLKCVHFETAVSEIDNIKSYLSGKWPYDGYGDPENNFKFITPEFLHQKKLGSRILALYKLKS